MNEAKDTGAGRAPRELPELSGQSTSAGPVTVAEVEEAALSPSGPPICSSRSSRIRRLFDALIFARTSMAHPRMDGAEQWYACAKAVTDALDRKTWRDLHQIILDSERLDCLLRFISIDDVGDEDFCPGVVVNYEDLEMEIGFPKGDDGQRRPTVMTLKDDMRHVLDRAIAHSKTNVSVHPPLKPEQTTPSHGEQ